MRMLKSVFLLLFVSLIVIQSNANNACGDSYRTDLDPDLKRALSRVGIVTTELAFDPAYLSRERLYEDYFILEKYLSENYLSINPEHVERILLWLGDKSSIVLFRRNNEKAPEILFDERIQELIENAPLLKDGLVSANSYLQSLAFVNFRESKNGLDLKKYLKSVSFIKKYFPNNSVFVDKLASLYANNLRSWLAAQLDVSIPEYNTFKMVKENIRQFFGIPHKVVQDVTVATSPDQMSSQVIVFSNRPIDNQLENLSGVYVKLVETVPIDKLEHSLSVSWQVEGKTATAQVVVRPVLEDILPVRESSFRFDELEQDGSLSGLIMISMNLFDFSTELAGYYVSHFKAKGFKVIDRKIVDFQEAADYVLNSTEKGHLDFALRDGHSEFSSDAMISLSNKVEVVVMHSTKSRLRKEMTLVFPSGTVEELSDGNPQNAISYAQFGEALRSRKVPDRQFIFADTACYGEESVKRMIELVATKGFLPLASEVEMETFTPEKGETIYELLQGLNKKSSYNEIKNQTKRSGQLIFPNSPKYLTKDDIKDLHPQIVHIVRDYQPMSEARP